MTQPKLPPLVAVFADADHAPLIDEHRGRDAEGHHVGEAVVFLAERALGAGPARHASIEAVEQHGDEHRAAGEREIAIDRGDDGIETGEQAAGGQQIGQQINATARRDSTSYFRRALGVGVSGVTAGIIGESLT